MSSKYRMVKWYSSSSVLPVGYTELTHIRASGTQYLNTGLTSNDFDMSQNSFSIEATFSLNSAENQSIFGIRYVGNKFWLIYYGNNILCSCTSDDGATGVSCVIGTDVTVKLAAASSHYDVFVDGRQVVSQRSATNPATMFSNASFYVGGLNLVSGSNYIPYANFKSFKITIGDELVRNMIPAKRNSDGKVGMYDIVGEVFYTSGSAYDYAAGESYGEEKEALIMVNGATPKYMIAMTGEN